MADLQVKPGQSAMNALLNSKHIFNVLAAAAPGSMGDVFRAFASSGMTPAEIGIGGKTITTFAKNLANNFSKNTETAPQHLDNLINNFKEPSVDRMIDHDIDRNFDEGNAFPDLKSPEEQPEYGEKEKNAAAPQEEEQSISPANQLPPEEPDLSDEKPFQAYPFYPEDESSPFKEPSSLENEQYKPEIDYPDDEEYDEDENSPKINKAQLDKQAQDLEKIMKKAERSSRRYVAPLERKRQNVKRQIKLAEKKILQYQAKIAYLIGLLVIGILFVIILLFVGLLLCWCGIGEVLWGLAGRIYSLIQSAPATIARLTAKIIQETFKIAKLKKLMMSISREIKKIQKKINDKIRPKQKQLQSNLQKLHQN